MANPPASNITCLLCKTTFRVIPSRVNEAKYCSDKCYWESKKGKSTWNKGISGVYHHPKEVRELISRLMRKENLSQETIQKKRIARLRQVLPKSDTSIERIVESWLDSLNIEYQHPFNFGNYQCDFGLPQIKL